MPASPPDSATARIGPFVAFVSVLFAGMAAGVLWCLVALSLTRGEQLVILPLAFGIGVYFRWLMFGGARAALCATLALLLAFAYAQYLFAAVRVAQMLGFPLRSTLFALDAGLAWQAARANVGVVDVVCLVVALVLGAAAAHGWRERQESAPESPG